MKVLLGSGVVDLPLVWWLAGGVEIRAPRGLGRGVGVLGWTVRNRELKSIGKA